MQVLEGLKKLTLGALQVPGEQSGKAVKRFKVVFAKPLDVARDFAAVLVPKSEADFQFLETALDDHLVFAGLGRREKKIMINAFEKTTVKKGAKIITQGDVGDYMYVILSGTVQFLVDGKDEGNASKGAVFGELALLYDCPRAATCKAETDCALFRVSQTTFRRIKASHVLQNDHETRTVLRNISIFQDLPPNYIHLLAESLFQKPFKKGEVLASKGAEATTFFIIKEGFVAGTDISIGTTKYANIRIGPGEFFGEGSIVAGTPLVGTVMALTDGTVYTLSKERFLRTLGHFDLRALAKKGQDTKLLSAIPLIAFSDIDTVEIGQMASKIEEKALAKDTMIAKVGEVVVPALYIIRSGKISLSNANVSKELQQGEVFGFGKETLVLTNELKGKNTAFRENGLVGLARNAAACMGEVNLKNNIATSLHNVVVMQDARVGVLTLEAMATILYDVLRLGREGSSLNPSITKDNLEKMRVLGAGTFGQVWLTRETKSNSAYAMKIQFKRELIAYGQAEGVIREKQVMEKMRHPFVMNIVNAQQDSSSLYMILDLIQGGELASQMHSSASGSLDDCSAQFYASCILEGLSYMHRRMFVYRDLKGENVLLDKDGYCVIVDLGFAKFVPDKTFTFCGTPLFIAPEIIQGTGHDKSADIWSLGVLIYEMLTGLSPFFNYKETNFDQRALYKRILQGKFDFPASPAVSPNAKDLIRKMLVVDPNERLGCLARADLDLRDHPWFASTNFCKLYKKEVSPPWVPAIKDPFDGCNFAKWDVEDKSGLKPLTAREQQHFADF